MSVEVQVSERRLVQALALHEARLSGIIHIIGTLTVVCAGERRLPGTPGPRTSDKKGPLGVSAKRSLRSAEIGNHPLR
jgi:hypothetical protein